ANSPNASPCLSGAVACALFLLGCAIRIEGRMQGAIRESRKGGNPQVDTDLSRGRMHQGIEIHLDLERDTPMGAIPGDSDILDGAVNLTTLPELDPADQRQIDTPTIQLEALRIPEAIGQKLLAIRGRSGTPCKEIGIGTFQVFQALLEHLRMHVLQPAVFLAFLPPSHQRCRVVIRQTWHTSQVPAFVQRKNFIPHEMTGPSKTDELCPRGATGFQSVF